MKTQQFNQHSKLVFKQFRRKGYSLFSALGKEVLIGVLSVSTLTYAKAGGIATKPASHADTLYLEARQLDEVIVKGARVPISALQSPKIVEVITRADIERAQVQTINDVLKLSTGVDVRQRGGFGVQTDISINGGTFDQITILLNGIPLTNPQTGHNAADFPVALFDIDHIEVLQGAATRIYGTAAFSGAINIVTRTATSNEVKLSAEGGSHGTFGGDAGLALAVPRRGNVAMSHQLSGGYTQSDGGTLNSDFAKRRAYYQGSLQSSHIGLNWQAGITSQDFGANTFYSAKFPNQYEWTRRYIGSVGAEVRPFAHRADNNFLSSLKLHSTLYGHRNIDHFQLIKGQTGAKAGENYHRTDVMGVTLNTLFEWVAGKTALGMEWREERILSTAYGDELPEPQWEKIGGTNRHYSRKGSRTNTSLFAEHNLVWQGFSLSAGVMANRNTGLNDNFRLYPGIDMSYRPNIHWKLYAGWNKALRVPTYTDLYTSNKAQQGDINLKPEQNSTIKVGAQYRTTAFTALLSSFYSHGTNMIDWVYETATSTRYQAMNIGRLDNMGVSLETTTDLTTLFHRDGQRRQHTLLKMGYAYIHQNHETDRAIYRSLYALEYLRHKLVVELSHPIVARLSASWAVRYQQRMNGYAPYAKLDGKITWNAPSWRLYLKADNITNHRYYDLGNVPQPGLWLMAGGSININL